MGKLHRRRRVGTNDERSERLGPGAKTRSCAGGGAGNQRSRFRPVAREQFLTVKALDTPECDFFEIRATTYTARIRR